MRKKEQMVWDAIESMLCVVGGEDLKDTLSLLTESDKKLVAQTAIVAASRYVPEEG